MRDTIPKFANAAKHISKRLQIFLANIQSFADVGPVWNFVVVCFFLVDRFQKYEKRKPVESYET